MQADANQTESSVAVRADLAAIFVSLELSRSKWLITSLSPGAGEKMSKFVVPGGDVSALLERFEHLQQGVGTERAKLSDHFDPGGWPGRLLDPPRSRGQRD